MGGIKMNRTFNSAVLELVRNGVDMFEALKRVENSGEFTEKEIQQWFDNFNNRKN